MARYTKTSENENPTSKRKPKNDNHHSGERKEQKVLSPSNKNSQDESRKAEGNRKGQTKKGVSKRTKAKPPKSKTTTTIFGKKKKKDRHSVSSDSNNNNDDSKARVSRRQQRNLQAEEENNNDVLNRNKPASEKRSSHHALKRNGTNPKAKSRSGNSLQLMRIEPPTNQVTPRRRGRPPKATRNGGNSLELNNLRNKPPTNQTTPGPRGRPPKASQPNTRSKSGNSLELNNLRIEPPTNQTTPRRRGRLPKASQPPTNQATPRCGRARPPKASQQNDRSNSGNSLELNNPRIEPPTNQATPRRRGRLPKATQPPTNQATPRRRGRLPKATQPPTNQATPRRRGRLPKATQPPTNQATPRRRGRLPKATQPPTNQATPRCGRGRPPKASQPPTTATASLGVSALRRTTRHGGRKGSNSLRGVRSTQLLTSRAVPTKIDKRHRYRLRWVRSSIQLAKARKRALIEQQALTERPALSKRQLAALKRAQMQQKQDKQILIKLRNESEDGLKMASMGERGRGVRTLRSFRKGDFVVEYKGELITRPQADARERGYKRKPSLGCFMYYFTHLDKRFCIDSTKESACLGRLVNHSSEDGNCRAKVFVLDRRIRLVFLAARDIRKGEELTCDYGDTDPNSLRSHPWLRRSRSVSRSAPEV